MGRKRDEWTTAEPVLDSAVAFLFWRSVDSAGRSSTECWPWRRSLTGDGYGGFALPFKDGKRRLRKASRVAWALVNGRWPQTHEVVMRTCDNRTCCNPAHLSLGTHKLNMDDMAKKGRASQGDEHWTRTAPSRVSRGSKVGTSKLTETQVEEIRALYAEAGGKRGVGAALALEYGVTRQLIWQIVKGKWWKHVALVEVESAVSRPSRSLVEVQNDCPEAPSTVPRASQSHDAAADGAPEPSQPHV